MSIPEKNGALKNHLLAALPKAEFVRLEPHLESVSLPLGKVIYESGEKMTHVYFYALHYGKRRNCRDWNCR
jgi:hypothetical protein